MDSVIERDVSLCNIRGVSLQLSSWYRALELEVSSAV
jgi:hypothetical protein